MKIRESLMSDIESFLLEALKLYNVEKIVNRSEYLYLESRICALSKDDFESKEKHKHFLRYIYQTELLAQRNTIQNLFSKNLPRKEHFINDLPHYFWVDKYLRTLLDWLK